MDENENVTENEPEPLCPGCLAPVDPLVHYCPHCGEATGDFTPIVPFVNIQFYANAYGAMWRKAWYDRNARFTTRILCLLVIAVGAPIMFIGLPFMIWTKIHGLP